jgi:hypothetical protein
MNCYVCGKETVSTSTPPVHKKCYKRFLHDNPDKEFDAEQITQPYVFAADDEGTVHDPQRAEALERLFEASLKLRGILHSQRATGCMFVYDRQLDDLGWFGILRELETHNG